MTWWEAARAAREEKVGRRGGANGDVTGIERSSERSLDVVNGNPGQTWKL